MKVTIKLCIDLFTKEIIADYQKVARKNFLKLKLK